MQGLEGGTAESSGLDAFEQLAGHVREDHGSWLAKWLRLVSLEERGTVERRAEIWSMTGWRDDSSTCQPVGKTMDFSKHFWEGVV